MAINRFPLVRGMLLRHSDTSGVAFCRRHVYSSRAGPVALSSQAFPAFNWVQVQEVDNLGLGYPFARWRIDAQGNT
jgi:hypothetical protein